MNKAKTGKISQYMASLGRKSWKAKKKKYSKEILKKMLSEAGKKGIAKSMPKAILSNKKNAALRKRALDELIADGLIRK